MKRWQDRSDRDRVRLRDPKRFECAKLMSHRSAYSIRARGLRGFIEGRMYGCNHYLLAIGNAMLGKTGATMYGSRTSRCALARDDDRPYASTRHSRESGNPFCSHQTPT